MAARQTTLSGMNASVLFGVALLVGGLSIILLKLFGAPQFVVTAAPVLVMLAYAGALQFVRGLRLREDQSGDNLYYLGFLYTLISLSLSLFEFDAESGATQIVSNFGIALATTIVGLALRILFNQMKKDPFETERQSRLELAEAARRLRSELDSSILDFNNFRRTTQQSVSDGLHELQAQTEQLLASSTNQVSEAVTQSAHRLEGVFSRFASASTEFNSKSENMTAALEKLTQRIDGIQVPTDLVEAQISPVVNKLESVTQAIASLKANEKERIELFMASAEEVLKVSGDVHQISEAQGQVIQELGKVAEKIDRSVERISRAAEFVSKNQTDFTNSSTDAIRALDKSIKTFEESGRQSATAISGARIALEGLSKKTQAQNEQLQSLAIDIKEEIKKIHTNAPQQPPPTSQNTNVE